MRENTLPPHDILVRPQCLAKIPPRSKQHLQRNYPHGPNIGLHAVLTMLFKYLTIAKRIENEDEDRTTVLLQGHRPSENARQPTTGLCLSAGYRANTSTNTGPIF